MKEKTDNLNYSSCANDKMFFPASSDHIKLIEQVVLKLQFS